MATEHQSKEAPEKGQRSRSTEKYVIAGILTFFIFSLGLALGFVLEDKRYAVVEELNAEQEVNYLSLQLQQSYLDSFSEQNNCPILSAALKNAVKDLDSSLSKVIAFEEEHQFSQEDHNLLQRRYVLDNLRYWLLAKENKERCHLDIVPILYFYTPECSSCPNQGTILSYFKSQFGERVLVFPINLNLKNEEAMVEVAISLFKITKYPTLVIDNQKYEGVVKQEQLQEIICASLRDAAPCQEKEGSKGQEKK